MRLLDENRDEPLKKLALYLTPGEAEQVMKALKELIADFGAGGQEHTHVSDRDHEHHLTLVVYHPSRVDGFQARYRRLIEEDT